MARQNKREIERQKAETHKKQLELSKARRRAGGELVAPEPEMEVKPSILIYCEGRNTEPSYFNQFKVSSAIVKAYGEGKNTLSLVEAAKKISDDASDRGKPFDQVWCVFDADPKPDNPKQLENFNAAVKQSEAYGFGTAYSNQAFEYWLVLHFEDHQGAAMPRTDYDPKLNKYLAPYGVTYDGKGTKKVGKDMFAILFEVIGHDEKGNPITRCKQATARSKRNYDNAGDHTNPGKEESSTRVHELVTELQKYT